MLLSSEVLTTYISPNRLPSTCLTLVKNASRALGPHVKPSSSTSRTNGSIWNVNARHKFLASISEMISVFIVATPFTSPTVGLLMRMTMEKGLLALSMIWKMLNESGVLLDDLF